MTETSELNFKGSNPGAVQHGNFINYYHFHPPDTRIKLLPTDVWGDIDEIICLDIGCNAGDLTIALYEYLAEEVKCKKCKILGIDIDPILINRATEKNLNENITFKCLDFMNDEERDNVLTTYLKSLNVTKFTATFCFSVTMWVHLNNGDDGLKKFIQTVCNISDMIILEPQPWKCYRTAVRRMKLSNEIFPLYKELKIKSSVEDFIEEIVLQCKFIRLTEVMEEKWKRKLQIFKKNSILNTIN